MAIQNNYFQLVVMSKVGGIYQKINGSPQEPHLTNFIYVLVNPRNWNK
jgi:hypothetical protein